MKGMMGEWVGLKCVDFRLAITVWYMNLLCWCVTKGMMRGWVGSKYVDFRLSHAITIWYVKNLLNWCVMKGMVREWVGLKYVDFRLPCHHYLVCEEPILVCYEGNDERLGWVKVCGFQTVPCHHYMVHEEPAKLLCYEGNNGRAVWVKYVDFRLVHAITIWYMNNLLFWCVTKGIVKGWVGLICRFHAIPCHHYLTHEKPANLVCYKGDNGRVR